jgi:hypothetical protein
MSAVYNIYCDESCHLEHDGHSVMVLGAVWCPLEKVKEISCRLREIKIKHGMPWNFEVKWTKVSGAKIKMYLEFVDYFFDDDHLHFRALIAPKNKLNHIVYNQLHDDWYYKMYFDMLKVLFEPVSKYRVYLDVKDTCGAAKIRKLHDVICNDMSDFQRSIVERVQPIRSHESNILQLADLMIGAISHINRGINGSNGKKELIQRIKDRSKYSLVRTTLFREEKVNLFRWQPSEILK